MRGLLLAITLVAAPALAGPRELAEAGWTAFQKHDLVAAEKLTREAVAKAGGDRLVLGAALYNLGRILEARGDKPGAIEAYRGSLTARPNATVRDRLRTLDRAAAESLDPFSPRPMQGPFASIEAYCKKSLDVYTDPAVRAILEPRCDDSIQELEPTTPAKLPGAYQELRVFRVPEDALRILAVKIGGDWYMLGLDPFEAPPNCHGDTIVEGITPRAGALQVTYTIDGHCEHRDWEWEWTERSFVLVGLGPSNQPAMTAPFQLAVTRTDTAPDKPPSKPVIAVDLSATWGKDGSLDLAPRRSDREISYRLADAVGHHTFTFP